MKIAGIAGGVGTTVTATILGIEDVGRDIEHADIIVARNDYRCTSALVEHIRDDQKIVLIVEPGRALLVRDIENALGRTIDAAINADPAVARADDAGLLTSARHHPVSPVRADLSHARHAPVSRLRGDLINALDIKEP